MTNKLLHADLKVLYVFCYFQGEFFFFNTANLDLH